MRKKNRNEDFRYLQINLAGSLAPGKTRNLQVCVGVTACGFVNPLRAVIGSHPGLQR